MALATTRRRPTFAPSPARWSPFAELEDLQSRMEALIGALPAADQGNGSPAPWLPYVDIEETENAWLVEAELPGVSRKDINVEHRDGELVITGDLKEKERKGILRRRTRRTGEFEFRVQLPGQTDADKVKANVKDGVLTVEIPKAAEAQPHRVEVTEGQGAPAS